MNRMDIRRRMLESAASGVSLSYTGDYDYFGDPVKGFAVLKTSGTLSIKGTVDLCLVGGGGKGHVGVYTGSPTGSYGGGGGAGGYVSNYTEQNLNDNFTVTIGSGSSTQGSAGGQTSVGASFTANGGNSPASSYYSVTGRGTSGSGGRNGYDAGSGEDGVFPFDDSANFSSYRVSGCGGGGARLTASAGSGGAGGGGNGGYTTVGVGGTSNTGGGGGGGAYYSSTGYAGGNGGTGVVIVCWGYTH